MLCRIIKGLTKITQNKSEKQPSTPAPQDAAAGQSSGKKERARTNNGAKRKQHLEVEVVEEDVEPEDPRFDKEQARLYKTRDVIRYELIPMRFIKKIYHVRTYTGLPLRLGAQVLKVAFRICSVLSWQVP